MNEQPFANTAPDDVFTCPRCGANLTDEPIHRTETLIPGTDESEVVTWVTCPECETDVEVW